jgi:branched-chain amino acid transport system ATP-binding protein
MAALLEVRALSAGYGSTQVLHGIGLEVAEGGITTVLGANGAGKTTLLRALCGMIRSSGQVRLRGQVISGRATEDIVRQGVAHVPDGRGTFLDLTTEENLRLGAYTRKDKKRVAEDFERLFGYFPRLRERRHQQAGTLSGGEQQMLALSRGLMLRPRLLLLDEPSFGLAPLVVQDIFRIMRRINQEEGVSMLLVEQNATLALDLADHVYLLETGRVVVSGPSSLRITDAWAGAAGTRRRSDAGADAARGHRSRRAARSGAQRRGQQALRLRTRCDPDGTARWAIPRRAIPAERPARLVQGRCHEQRQPLLQGQSGRP